MNWYALLAFVFAELSGDETLNGVDVVMGLMVPVPDKKAEVRLIRGGYDPKSNDPTSRDAFSFTVECWEFDDSDDPATGYQKLAALEKTVFEIINRIGRGDRRIDGRSVRIRPGRSEPDRDFFRPMIGSSTTFNVIWQ